MSSDITVMKPACSDSNNHDHEHSRSSEVEGVGESDGFGDVGESR